MSNYTPDYKKGAVNPYNFVSLGNGVTRNEPIKGKLTGVIHCSMINATPLAIPDFPNQKTEKVRNEKGKIEDHNKVPFFRVNGKPVITGSEIRGVIHSAYETLSNSCLSVNNDNILSARSADIRNPGLSPAQISRHRVDDLLGSYRHCDDTNYVCEACNLFGMIGKNDCDPSAIASRLRFTDAAVEKESKLFYATLKELASPHISSVEFYSTAPNMKHQWNYDTRGIKLNGRKYYFHHKGDYSTRVKNGRNITAELIDKGAKFGFDIFFEMFTEDELKKLVWTLTIGENKADGNQMHKIGHGKPIGLGSVKIIVDSVITRSFDPIKTEFTDKELDVDKLIENIPFDENAAYFNEFKSITDFDYLEGKKVAYPYGDDGNDKKTSKGTLTWFKANHNDGKTVNPDEKCNIRYHLPKITDKENLVLPALIKDGKSGKERSSGGVKRTESSYNVPTSFSGKVTDPNSAKFMCRKCNTWNVVQKSVPFPKPNLPIICKKCGNKFYEKY